MPEKQQLFLSKQKAIEAIRADFSQYAPQKHLLLELCRVILGSGTAFQTDGRGRGVWLSTSKPNRMQFLDYRALGEHLCNLLEKTSPSPDLLSAVCSRVFRTTVDPGPDTNGKSGGVWINTGMEDFVCRQCGRCCQTLDFHKECTIEDYARWNALGRRDILKWVSLVRKDGRVISCRIWVKPGTRQYVEGCPWLIKISEKNRYDCRIHEIRPNICRQYPGSRKHAEMTGCIGFHGTHTPVRQEKC